MARRLPILLLPLAAALDRRAEAARYAALATEIEGKVRAELGMTKGQAASEESEADEGSVEA